MKAALLVLVLGGTASLAFVQRVGDLAPPRLESFWPTSFVTWLAVVTFGITSARYWKDRQKDTTAGRKEAMDAAVKPLLDKVGTMETHFDGEVQRMELLVERTGTAIRSAITQDINGWGRRVEVLERGDEVQGEFNESVVRFMGQSETHRAALGQQIGALTQTVDRRLEMIDGKIDRLLESMVQLRGGKNQ